MNKIEAVRIISQPTNTNEITFDLIIIIEKIKSTNEKIKKRERINWEEEK
jgi:hypothetical protein